MGCLEESCTIYPEYPDIFKALETATLAGSADGAEEIKRVLAEKNQLQAELQRCLQEMQQKDLHFQQINSKVTWSSSSDPHVSLGWHHVGMLLKWWCLAWLSGILLSNLDFKTTQPGSCKSNVSFIFLPGFPDLVFD